MPFSPLEHRRLAYQPQIPPIFSSPRLVGIAPRAQDAVCSSEVVQALPYGSSLPLLRFDLRSETSFPPLRVGVVFSGGQAPGGHNVVAGLFDAITALHAESLLFGFLGGPDGLIDGRHRSINEATLALYRNQGGFDLLGSGRTKWASEQQWKAIGNTLETMKLDGLVVVGGDDSNTNAAHLTEYCIANGIATRVIGVPKTIDGDLANQYVEIPFGFDTATKVYAEIVGNLAKDALSSKKYYFFIKMMGRSASHIVLEVAHQTQINLALIGEEMMRRGQSLRDVVGGIADLIMNRGKHGKYYGVILIPEGILEFIPECKLLLDELNVVLQSDLPKSADFLNAVKAELSLPSRACFSLFPEEIQLQLCQDRDSHGNVQLSKIEIERFLIMLVHRELKERGWADVKKFQAVPLFCGYEGRSALPTNFDCTYTYALGLEAALLIAHRQTGYMACIRHLNAPVQQWEPVGVPLAKMCVQEQRGKCSSVVIAKHFVDLESVPFLLFDKKRPVWALDDDYRSPGPIQWPDQEQQQDLLQGSPLALQLRLLRWPTDAVEEQ